MIDRLLHARPISEGFLIQNHQQRVVWRDYRWNTGVVFRWWFVDPQDAKGLQIEVTDLC